MITYLRRYFVVLPIVYLFVSIFLLRSWVEYIYLSSLVMVALTYIAHRGRKLKPEVLLAYWILILAAIGISAATILSIEKIEILSDPNHIASCSISPIVACSPVITSPQASAFGFPNPFIGLFGFTAVFTAAMTLLAGATKLTRVWWRTLLGGTAFGAAFCVWLMYQGMFDIGALCLYCLLTWLVTFALFWLVLAYSIQNKYINLGTKLNRLVSHKLETITLTYTAILVIIMLRWADYWQSLL